MRVRKRKRRVREEREDRVASEKLTLAERRNRREQVVSVVEDQGPNPTGLQYPPQPFTSHTLYPSTLNPKANTHRSLHCSARLGRGV